MRKAIDQILVAGLLGLATGATLAFLVQLCRGQ